MTSTFKWLFYFFFVRSAICVRIYKNFAPTTAPTRRTPFEPEVISKTCMLKPDKGPCRANIPMYYYDNKAEDCLNFVWGGCQGNGNRFDSHKECLDSCLSREGMSKRQPKYCLLTFDYGYCFGALERYYYDHVWQTCKKTIYSGCGGNKNNFIFEEQCQAICVHRTGPIKYKAGTTDKLKKFLIINPGPTRLNPDGKVVPDYSAIGSTNATNIATTEKYGIRHGSG